MVKNLYSFSGNGLKDWVWQRASAAFMFIYFSLLVILFLYKGLSVEIIKVIFKNNIIKISSVIFLLLYSVHAWIGMWTIGTDYLNNTVVRNVYNLLVFTYIISVLVWGLFIVIGSI